MNIDIEEVPRTFFIPTTFFRQIFGSMSLFFHAPKYFYQILMKLSLSSTDFHQIFDRALGPSGYPTLFFFIDQL